MRNLTIADGAISRHAEKLYVRIYVPGRKSLQWNLSIRSRAHTVVTTGSFSTNSAENFHHKFSNLVAAPPMELRASHSTSSSLTDI